MTSKLPCSKKPASKIAKKYWPQVGEKLDTVIQYLNTTAGEGIASHDVPISVVERYMGAAEVVDEAQPLPTSNEVEEQVPATDTTDAEPVDVQSQAPAPLEGEVLQASNNESQAPVDLPPKVLKKTQAVVNRARESQGWKAARE